MPEVICKNTDCVNNEELRCQLPEITIDEEADCENRDEE